MSRNKRTGRGGNRNPDTRGSRDNQERREAPKNYNIGDIIQSDQVHELRRKNGRVEVVTSDGVRQTMEVKYPRLKQLQDLLDEAQRRDGGKPTIQIVGKKERRQGDTVTGYSYEVVIGPAGADAEDLREEAIAYERSRQDQKLEAGGIFYSARIQRRMAPNEYIATVPNPSGGGEVVVRIVTNKVLSNNDIRRPVAIGILGEVQQQSGKIDGRQTFRAVLLDDPKAYDEFHRGNTSTPPADNFQQFVDPSSGRMLQLEAILRSPLVDRRGIKVESRGSAREIVGTDEWIIDRKKPTGDARAIRVRSILNQGSLDQETHFRVVRAREEQTEVLSIPEQEYKLVSQYIRAGSLINHYTTVFEQALLHEKDVPTALQPRFLELINTIHDEGLMKLSAVAGADPVLAITELYDSTDPVAEIYKQTIDDAQAALRRTTLQLDALLPDTSWLQASRFPAGGQSATRDSYRVANDYSSRMSVLDIQQGAKGRTFTALSPAMRRGVQGTSREMKKYAGFLSEQEMRNIDHGGDVYDAFVDTLLEEDSAFADFIANKSIEFGGVFNVTQGTTKNELAIKSSYSEVVESDGTVTKSTRSWDLIKGDTIVDIEILPSGEVSFDTITRRTKRESLKQELQQEAAGAADVTIMNNLLVELQHYGPAIVDQGYFRRQILLLGRKDTNAIVTIVENIDDQEAGAMRANLHAASFEELVAFITGRRSGTGLDVAPRSYQQMDTENDQFAREARAIIADKIWDAIFSAVGGNQSIVDRLKQNGVDFQVATVQDLTNESLQCVVRIDGQELTTVDIHPDAAQSTITDALTAVQDVLRERQAAVDKVKSIRHAVNGLMGNREACNRILLAHGVIAEEILFDELPTPIAVLFNKAGEVTLDLYSDVIGPIPVAIYEELITAGAFEIEQEHVELATASFEQIVAYISGVTAGSSLDSLSRSYNDVESGGYSAAAKSQDIITNKIWEAVATAVGDPALVEQLRLKGIAITVADAQNRKNAALQCEVTLDGESVMPLVDIHPDKAQSTIDEMIAAAEAMIVELEKRRAQAVTLRKGAVGRVENLQAVSRLLLAEGIINTNLSFPADTDVMVEVFNADTIFINGVSYSPVTEALFAELQISGGIEIIGARPILFPEQDPQALEDWAWNEGFVAPIQSGDVFIYNGEDIPGNVLFTPGMRLIVQFAPNGDIQLFRYDALNATNKWDLDNVDHVQNDTFIGVTPDFLAMNVKRGILTQLEESSGAMAEFLSEGNITSLDRIIDSLDLNPIYYTSGTISAEFLLKHGGHITDTEGNNYAFQNDTGSRRQFKIAHYDTATRILTIVISPDETKITVSVESMLQAQESDPDMFVRVSSVEVERQRETYETMTWKGLKNVLAEKGFDVSQGIPYFYTLTADAATPRSRFIYSVSGGEVLIKAQNAEGVEEETKMLVAEFLHNVDLGLSGQVDEPALVLEDKRKLVEVTDFATFDSILKKQNIDLSSDIFDVGGVKYNAERSRDKIKMTEIPSTTTVPGATVNKRRLTYQEFLNEISKSAITADVTSTVAGFDSEWVNAQKGEIAVLLEKAMVLKGFVPEDLYAGLFIVDNDDPKNNGRCYISPTGTAGEVRIIARNDDGTVTVTETLDTVEVLRMIVNGELISREAAIEGKFDSKSHIERQRQKLQAHAEASSNLITTLDAKLPGVYKLPGIRTLKIVEDVRRVKDLANEYDTLVTQTLQPGGGFDKHVPTEIRELIAEQARLAEAIAQEFEKGRVGKSVGNIREITRQYEYLISALKMERYMQQGTSTGVEQADIERVLEMKAGVGQLERERFIRAKFGGRYGDSQVPAQMRVIPTPGWDPTSGEDRFSVELSTLGTGPAYAERIEWTDFLKIMNNPTDERIRVARESQTADLAIHALTDEKTLRGISTHFGWTALGRRPIEEKIRRTVQDTSARLDSIRDKRLSLDFSRQPHVEGEYLHDAHIELSKLIADFVTTGTEGGYKTENALVAALDEIREEVNNLASLYEAHVAIEYGRYEDLQSVFLAELEHYTDADVSSMSRQEIQKELGITIVERRNPDSGLLTGVDILYTSESGSEKSQPMQHALESLLKTGELDSLENAVIAESAEPKGARQLGELLDRYPRTSIEHVLVAQACQLAGVTDIDELFERVINAFGKPTEGINIYEDGMFDIYSRDQNDVLKKSELSIREFASKVIKGDFFGVQGLAADRYTRTIPMADGFSREYIRLLPPQDVVAFRQMESFGITMDKIRDGWLRTQTGEEVVVERADQGRIMNSQRELVVTIAGTTTGITSFNDILNELQSGRFEVRSPEPQFGAENLETDKPTDEAEHINWALAAIGSSENELDNLKKSDVTARSFELQKIYDVTLHLSKKEEDRPDTLNVDRARRLKEARKILLDYIKNK